MIRLMFAILISFSVSGVAQSIVVSSPSSVASTETISNDESQTSIPKKVDTGEAKANLALKETEIPVHLENAKKGAATESPWMRMLGGLAIVGILAAGLFLLIKRTKSANRTSSLAPQIKVLTQHYLGPKKSLAIIRVAGESILVGITEQNISMIKSLSLLDEDVPEIVPGSFESVFNERSDETAKDFAPPAKVDRTRRNQDDETEEFSISGIKDVVTNRLKNMRNFQ